MEKYDITQKTSYCLGMSLTIEALLHRSSFVKEVILSEKANRNYQLDELFALCAERHVPYRYDDRTIDRLSVKENCYCIGVFEKYSFPLKNKEHIVLYGFDDFGELGTVLRSAVAFDFRDISLVSSAIDHFDPRCIRASMGSFFHCNIERFDDLEDYLKRYPTQHLYPLLSASDTELSAAHFEAPYSIILSQDLADLDDKFKKGICIDHHGDDEMSLSIRSSILLQEAFSQKRRR